MIWIYLKTAWRNITKRRFYSLLNISGLALAIGCGILIYLYTSYQLSFDNYHQRVNSIYRVVYELHFEKTEYDKGSSVAAYEALRSGSASVRQAAISFGSQSFVVDVTGTNKRFKEDRNIAFTNAAWFKLFTYRWLSGAATQLDEPNTAALTNKQAKKYFGDADPMGKTVLINGQQLKIVGIVADAPYNTDLRSDMYLSFSSIKTVIPKIEPSFYTDWGYLMSTNNLFVSLTDPGKKPEVEKQLADITKKRFGDGAKFYSFKLLPLKEIHFDTRYGAKIQRSLLVTLSVIGLLIMLIAIVNYVNLTIAGQTRRSVEIGTRKVLGGSVGQLFTQFMVESLLNALIATAVAVTFVMIALPNLNSLLFENDPIHIISYRDLGLFIIGMLLFITIGTGIYPAFVLSRTNVFRALKNNLGNMQAGFGRKILVLLQNVVAQVLIACTIVIVMQVRFLKNTDKGFDRKFVVMVPVGDIREAQKEQFKQDLSSIPGVVSTSFCRRSPSSDSQMGATFKFADRPWEKLPARFAIGDPAYCGTFGLKIVAGRNIRPNPPVPEYLVNETLVSLLHFKNNKDVLGQKLLPGDVTGVIVGVVKDFNVRSLMEPIEPSVVLENKVLQTNLAIKFSGYRSSAALMAIQHAYTRAFPTQVFTYQFVDDEIAELYKTQTLQQKLIWGTSAIAIFISSLGLLGLISLITLHRTKEIGIRKVLGASIAQINMLLSKDFLVIVLLGLLVSCPIAWWVMNKWLQSFAYRITINWWVFAVTAGAAILIAVLTISLQTIKAASANPVKSLRSE